MKIIQAAAVALGCTFPALAQAQAPPPQQYVVRVEVIDSGKTVAAPRIVMHAGAVAGMSVSDDVPVDRQSESDNRNFRYRAVVSLPPESLVETGRFPIHIVLQRFMNQSGVKLADRDVTVRIGEAATLQTAAPPGGAPGRPLSLVIEVARSGKNAGTRPASSGTAASACGQICDPAGAPPSPVQLPRPGVSAAG